LIRCLRKERGLSQGDLITPAGSSDRDRLHQKLISEIEGGKPTKGNNRRRIETIQVLFDSMERQAPSQPIPAATRHAILRGLGLMPTTALPTPPEIARVASAWKAQFDDLPYPAYLVDIVSRVHAWNAVHLSLIGVRETDPFIENATIVDLLFSEFGRSRLRLQDRDNTQKRLLTRIKADLEQFQCDEWWRPVIRDVKAKYSEFAALWDTYDASELRGVTLGTMGSYKIDISGRGLLEFRVLPAATEGDMRFVSVQYVPMDEESMRKCCRIIRS